jgi:HK97 family phage portal protein
MGIFSRFFTKTAPPAPAAETRASEDPSWAALSAWSPVSSFASARLAENLSVVLACTSAISTAIASLPAEVQRRTSAGWAADDRHPLARLIAGGPNEHQSWPDFLEWLVASTVLRGNGLAELVTDGAGMVTALLPVPWDRVSVHRLPNGRLRYDVAGDASLPGSTGRPRRLLDSEVLHLRDRTDDGLVGISRLRRAACVVQVGLSLQDVTAAIYANGIRPSGLLEAPGAISDETAERLKEGLLAAVGGSATAKALVLGDGLKWTQMSINPEDAELLASRRFAVEELARLFGVPPPVVGDLTHGSFTNSETMLRWFSQSTLSPWVRKLEAAFSRAIIMEPGTRLEIDLQGLLRGDPETRWASHAIAVKNRILTRNEIREAEGWNRLDGFDAFDDVAAGGAA